MNINDFIRGMKHAENIAANTGKGTIAANAIRKEITTIELKKETLT